MNFNFNSRLIIFLLATLYCFVLSPAFAEASPPTTRLPRTNLFVYHDRKGEVAPVRSKSDWQKRRKEIVRGMEEIMGPLPGKEKRCPLDLKVVEEVDCGSY